MIPPAEAFDVVVVGAGLGGVYAVHRFLQQGLKVVALERGAGIGGVWRHNRYPGARVDVDSLDYCFHFSPELYRDWKWSERYASQRELLSYLEHVVDRLGLRPHIRLSTPFLGSRWDPQTARHVVRAGDGAELTARFLVLAMGNLSEPRLPDFPGLERFEGDWVQTSWWPDKPVETAGKRIGVIGTGSSGVQAVTALAEVAGTLHVFQRSPNFAVPAQNRPLDPGEQAVAAADVPARRAGLLQTRAATTGFLDPPRDAADYSADEQRARMEAQWRAGGQGMSGVFADQRTSKAANDIVAEFVRGKIRERVRDPALAEKLCPKDHPIGSRRLCLDTGYYEVFNQGNVTLVDVAATPIAEITETGIRTSEAQYDLDLIVFALGFQPFIGAFDATRIENGEGAHLTDGWRRGPRSLLGLMTTSHPNVFTATGPGSPSVLANMMVMNEIHMDWIAECIAHMDAHGHVAIEPTADAQEAWVKECADAASQQLRLGVKNYMVHVNADGSRVFMPYIGGLKRYCEFLEASQRAGYEGFRFR